MRKKPLLRKNPKEILVILSQSCNLTQRPCKLITGASKLTTSASKLIKNRTVHPLHVEFHLDKLLLILQLSLLNLMQNRSITR